MPSRDWTFTNPYNFIEVDFSKNTKDKKIQEIISSSSLRTGFLDCRLITKTPLAIPDIENPTPQDVDEGDGIHNAYPFLRNSEGKYMIPAGSIRGPVRSMYEALTDSCFSTSSEEEIITIRTKKAFKPGLLKKDTDGNWHLYEATRYLIYVTGQGYSDYNRNDNPKNCASVSRNDLAQKAFADPVWFTPSTWEFRKVRYNRRGNQQTINTGAFFTESFSFDTPDGTQDNFLCGYLCVGEKSPQKHFESIFYSSWNKEVQVDQHYVAALDEIIKLYNDPSVNKKKQDNGIYDYYKDRDYGQADIKKPLPVWYTMSGNDAYLSVASIGRYAFRKTMKDMLGEKRPCKKRYALCPACSLFGMAGEESLGSRLRFTDAIIDEEHSVPPETDPVTLKELSSPKPSYMPFYLSNIDEDNPASWSYDSPTVSLRGRKMYWHDLRAKTDKSIYTADTKTKRNASMELVPPETWFRFKVYYNGITDDELAGLIWTLVMGCNEEDESHCFKIGHGKPIGLGSAKIIITEKTERSFSKENAIYQIDSIDCSKPAGKDEIDKIVEKGHLVFKNHKMVDQILTITNLNGYDNINPIEYPGFDWFRANYALGNAPNYVLPEIYFLTGETAPVSTAAQRNDCEYVDNGDYEGTVLGTETGSGGKIKVILETDDKIIRVKRQNVTYKQIGKKELENEFPEKTKVKLKYIKDDDGSHWECIGKLT